MKSVDLMKGKLEEQHKEHGRLKTEDQVRTATPPTISKDLAPLRLQYHKERIASRDKNMVSTAATYPLPGDYREGPFHQATVSQFFREFAQYKTQAKEEAEAEKVRLYERLFARLSTFVPVARAGGQGTSDAGAVGSAENQLSQDRGVSPDEEEDC